MDERIKRLLTPDGVKDLLPGQAGMKRQTENRILEVFTRWGYGEVATPTFEYGSTFESGPSNGPEGRIYRFLDERGRAMALRPDFTLPLARVASTHLAGAPRPLRLCYGGSIFRNASSQQGKQRELSQAGVELIGADCAGSDAEILALAVETLQALGLTGFTLCLGHVGFLQSLLEAHGVDESIAVEIKEFVCRKDFVALRESTGRLPLEGSVRESVLRIPSLRGGREILYQAASLVPQGKADSSLAVIDEIWQALEDFGASRYITIDLGLVRAMDYYTGMVFEGYTSGLGFPICGGGRYDMLLGNFGAESPAVGFALNIDHLLVVLERQKRRQAEELIFAAYAAGGRPGAIAAAQGLRSCGTRVIIDVMPRAPKEAEQEARQLGAARLLYFDESGCMEETGLTARGGGAPCSPRTAG